MGKTEHACFQRCKYVGQLKCIIHADYESNSGNIDNSCSLQVSFIHCVSRYRDKGWHLYSCGHNESNQASFYA